MEAVSKNKAHFITLTVLVAAIAYNSVNLGLSVLRGQRDNWIWGYAYDIGKSLRFFLGQIPPTCLRGHDGTHLQMTQFGQIRFQSPSLLATVPPKFSPALRDIARELENEGVTLIILPVPTKLSVERELFPQKLPGIKGDREDPYVTEKFLNDLVPDQSLNLFSAYRNFYLSHPTQFLYPPLDYHWSSQGISVAAIETLAKLRSRGWRFPQPSVLQEVATANESWANILFHQFALPTFLIEMYQPMQWAEPLFRFEGNSKSVAKNGRIIFLGTSFLERFLDSPYGLAENLSIALNREPYICGFGGAGVWGSMIALMESHFQLNRGDLIIWEFPVHRIPHVDSSDVGTAVFKKGELILQPKELREQCLTYRTKYLHGG